MSADYYMDLASDLYTDPGVRANLQDLGIRLKYMLPVFADGCSWLSAKMGHDNFRRWLVHDENADPSLDGKLVMAEFKQHYITDEDGWRGLGPLHVKDRYAVNDIGMRLA